MRILKICGLLIIFAAIFCIGAQAEPFQGYINSDGINVRADSTPNAEVICVLAKGTQVNVVRENYDWYKITLPKNAPSFVKKAFLECLPEEASKSSQSPIPLNQKGCHSAKVTGDNVNIRLKPSEGAKILGRLNKNTIVSVLEEVGNWVRIEPVGNSYAWVHKKFVSKEFVKTPLKKAESAAIHAVEPQIVSTSGQITAEGIVQPYGKIFNRKATHKLITKENNIYLLKGNKQGLDSLNYRRVKITGKINDAIKEKYPVIEIFSTEALN